MKKTWYYFVTFIIVIMISTGCAYPQDKLAQNQVPYESQIEMVQMAVNKFREDSGGLLPIKTKESNTPIYQKYLIDFNKLIPKYMAEPPGSAYEAGGIYQYCLVDVETNPTVKIFDLRMAERIRDINLRISIKEYPPYKERLANNVFSIDFEKIGLKEEPMVTSPYSNLELPFVITGSGEIYIDYRKDLMQLLQNNTYEFSEGEDIRWILHEQSFFVPAYSLPYTYDPETNQPIFLEQ